MMGAAFRAAATLGVATSVLCHVLYNPYVNLWGDRALAGNATALCRQSTRCSSWYHRG